MIRGEEAIMGLIEDTMALQAVEAPIMEQIAVIIKQRIRQVRGTTKVRVSRTVFRVERAGLLEAHPVSQAAIVLEGEVLESNSVSIK